MNQDSPQPSEIREYSPSQATQTSLDSPPQNLSSQVYPPKSPPLTLENHPDSPPPDSHHAPRQTPPNSQDFPHSSAQDSRFLDALENRKDRCADSPDSPQDLQIPFSPQNAHQAPATAGFPCQDSPATLPVSPPLAFESSAPSPPLSSVRGFGYWAWKPQVILQSLAQIAEGDYLIYADIGCTWGRGEAARERLREMLARVESAAGFCLEGCLEFQWTKGDIFAHFGALERPEIAHTPQVAATFIFMKKCEKTLKIIKSWRQIALENFDLITDCPSRAPNFAGFVENRHDQSLWSVLNKIHRLENFAFSELRGEDAVLRDARAKLPIHPRAHTWGNLALSLYILATVLNIYRWRFVHFLKRLRAYARAKCKALWRKISAKIH